MTTTTAEDYGASAPELETLRRLVTAQVPGRSLRRVHAKRRRERRVFVSAPEQPVGVGPLAHGAEGRTARPVSGTLAVPADV